MFSVACSTKRPGPTKRDEDHASGAQIRQHHNATLPDIVSFGPRIEARLAADVVFGI